MSPPVGTVEACEKVHVPPLFDGSAQMSGVPLTSYQFAASSRSPETFPWNT